MQIFSDRDRAILKLAQVAAEGNCLYELPPNKLLKMTVSNDAWWNGIILTPSKERPGLLPQIVFDGMRSKRHYFHLKTSNTDIDTFSENRGRCFPKVCVQSSASFDSSSETESSDNYKSNKLLKQFSTTTSSDGCESDFSSPRPIKPRARQTRYF